MPHRSHDPQQHDRADEAGPAGGYRCWPARDGAARSSPALARRRWPPSCWPAEGAVTLFRPVDFDTPTELWLRFGRAGHINGSAWAELALDDGGTLVVSGGLGRPRHPMLNPPQPRPICGTLLGSTYGGSEPHDEDTARHLLARAIGRTARRGGSVLIPAFAASARASRSCAGCAAD
ncbi:MAG TPA: hypothetical protein VGJ95_05575 [Pseudonocardiaceae bacterium]